MEVSSSSFGSSFFFGSSFLAAAAGAAAPPAGAGPEATRREPTSRPSRRPAEYTQTDRQQTTTNETQIKGRSERRREKRGGMISCGGEKKMRENKPHTALLL